MKKIVALMMAAGLCLSLAACAAPAEAPAAAAEAPAEAAAEAPAEAAPAASASATAHDLNGDGKLVVYGIYKAGDQSWFINEGASAQAAVEEAGGEFFYVDAAMNPETYLKAIDNAIANKADGIVTCIPDQTLSQGVVDTLKAAGIPVVAADDALQDASGAKLVPWVGIDGYNIGYANGEWIVEYINANNLAADETCGILIMTMDTVSSCVPRTDGETAAITEKCPDFSTGRIFYADYDGTTDKGNTVAAAIFTAHPEIKTWIVTGANEEGTVGAVRALETAGLDSAACVVGMGAYLAKDEYKKDSCMKAAAWFSDVAIGRGSVEVLFRLIDGEEVAMEQAVDAIIVTPENYESIMGDAAK